MDNDYVYDKMGNRTASQHLTQANSYNVAYANNNLNQTTGRVGSGAGAPAFTESLVYDASGNLREWGDKRLTYDDENRLVSVVQLTEQGTNQHKSEFLYDGFNRRRVVREYNWQSVNGTWTWAPQTEQWFIYDGFNVVQERDGNDAITAKNVWGISLGGGIGGLLSRTTAQDNLYYHYDGRGNVVQLTDANAQVVARYSYDAFGNIRRSEGAQAGSNPYRFSTKWFHAYSNLSDYGFRFYAPTLGKWINRDSIEEQGGINLYGFVDGNPVSLLDRNGRVAWVLVGAVVGGTLNGLGNLVGQILTNLQNERDWDCINWKSLGIAVGAGAIGGGLIATGYGGHAGAMLFTGFANTGQYIADTVIAQCSTPTVEGTLFAGGTGMLAGYVGGPFIKPDAVKPFGNVLANWPWQPIRPSVSNLANSLDNLATELLTGYVNYGPKPIAMNSVGAVIANLPMPMLP